MVFQSLVLQRQISKLSFSVHFQLGVFSLQLQVYLCDTLQNFCAVKFQQIFDLRKIYFGLQARIDVYFIEVGKREFPFDKSLAESGFKDCYIQL